MSTWSDDTFERCHSGQRRPLSARNVGACDGLLGFESLTGTIPTEVGALRALSILELRGNALSGSVPTELGLLTALVALDVSRNALTGAVPTELAALPFALVDAAATDPSAPPACALTSDFAFSVSNRFAHPAPAAVAAQCVVLLDGWLALAGAYGAFSLAVLALLAVALRSRISVGVARTARAAHAKAAAAAGGVDAEAAPRGAALRALELPGLVRPPEQAEAPPPRALAPLAPYGANRASAPGVLVSVPGALAALDALERGQPPADAARRARPRLALARPGDPPEAAGFAMVSYASALLRDAPGRAALRAALRAAAGRGYSRLWWDWLVIDVDDAAGRPYVQAQFEAAMHWASASAHVVLVVWPTVPAARAYLQRPWCCSELATAARRRVACALVGDEGALYKDPRADGAQRAAAALLGWGWLASLVVVALGVASAVDASPLGRADSQRALSLRTVLSVAPPALYVYASAALAALARQWLEARHALSSHAYGFPANALAFLHDPPRPRPRGAVARCLRGPREDDAARAATRAAEALVRALRTAGHLRAPMYDVGDAPVCAAVLGVRPAPFVFDQALLKLLAPGRGADFSPAALAAAFAVRGAPHRAIDGGRASWLSGELATSAQWAAVPAVSPEYAAPLALCASRLAPRDAADADGDAARRGCCGRARPVVLARALLVGPALQGALLGHGLLLMALAGLALGLTVGLHPGGGCPFIGCEPGERDPPPAGGAIASLAACLALEHALAAAPAAALASGRWTLVGTAPGSARAPGLHLLLLAHLLACTIFGLAALPQALLYDGWRLGAGVALGAYALLWLPVLALGALLEAPATLAQLLLCAPCRGVAAALEFHFLRAALRVGYPSGAWLLRVVRSRTVS